MLARLSRPVTRGHSVSLFSRNCRNYTTPPLKVAVIGAGPSGFYAASRLLQLLPPTSELGANLTVDMYERLPTPYGLARYGVAPDHPEVKNCQHKFDEITNDPRFNFFGNVSIGTPTTGYDYPHALHIPLSTLQPYYNTLLLTYGASQSNPLGIPGSTTSPNPLGNIYAALSFVGWYNGHPAFADLNPNLEGIQSVDIVGQGNVALDVARILLSPIGSLAGSDLPERVLDTLAKSTVKRVRAVGRRGPAQVAFTTKELREMTKLGVGFDGVDPSLMEAAKKEVKGDRMRTRMLGLMEKPVVGGDNEKSFGLEFLRSPIKFIPDDAGDVRAVEWGINEVVEGRAVATGASEVRDVDMVVESVGYRSEPIDARVPFDHGKGRVVNDGGRVDSGTYAAGWVARGPVGVIASTMQDAYGLVDRVLEDYQVENREGRVVEPGVPGVIEEGVREGKVVNLERWGRIDEAERELGKRTGREEREKFATEVEMLAVQ